MKLYAYVVTHDTGFAPNPFWGYCTLACCKPVIRRTGRAGDWIVGLTPKSKGSHLLYAMHVEEVIPMDQYYGDPRFVHKIPDYANGSVIFKRGDNIYKPLEGGGFLQLESRHSNRAEEDLDKKAHDLSGENVLVSRRFYYFGSKPLPLPKALADLKVGRGHKNKFPPSTVSLFGSFISMVYMPFHPYGHLMMTPGKGLAHEDRAQQKRF